MIDTFSDERLRKQKRFFGHFCEIVRSASGGDALVEAYLAFERKAERDALCATQPYLFEPVARAHVLRILGRFTVIDGVCISQRKKDEKTFYDDLIDGLEAKILLLLWRKGMAASENINTKSNQEDYIRNLENCLKQKEKDYKNIIRNIYMH